MRFARRTVLMLAIAVLWMGSAHAQHGNPCCCLCGKKVCVLKVSQEQESVTRFDVESKEICIPGIRLPWQPCGTRRCGGVRQVCVLKEVKEEETVCKYDWSIKTICTTCCRKHGLKNHHARVNRDERVPFEFYVADAEPEATASADYRTASPTAPQSTAESALVSFERPIVPQVNLPLPSESLETAGSATHWNKLHSTAAKFFSRLVD